MHSFLLPCGEEVKANNEKRRTRALPVRVEGMEVGGRCTFEKGLPVVDT